ncbi:SDCB1 protein, partial [Polypterus senegalus]
MKEIATRPSALNYMIAPVTGNDAGVRRAEIKQGIREVVLCKDFEGKIGLRLKSVDNGIFVQLVQYNSPAALAGMRFGDQVLQINGENCAGWSTDKAHKILKQASAERITFVVRDRPFERTITLHKDYNGHLGFVFKKGKISFIVQDSSAARNGLLTEHNICEINGQNVIGLKVWRPPVPSFGCALIPELRLVFHSTARTHMLGNPPPKPYVASHPSLVTPATQSLSGSDHYYNSRVSA